MLQIDLPYCAYSYQIKAVCVREWLDLSANVCSNTIIETNKGQQMIYFLLTYIMIAVLIVGSIILTYYTFKHDGWVSALKTFTLTVLGTSTTSFLFLLCAYLTATAS